MDPQCQVLALGFLFDLSLLFSKLENVAALITILSTKPNIMDGPRVYDYRTIVFSNLQN